MDTEQELSLETVVVVVVVQIQQSGDAEAVCLYQRPANTRVQRLAASEGRVDGDPGDPERSCLHPLGSCAQRLLEEKTFNGAIEWYIPAHSSLTS